MQDLQELVWDYYHDHGRDLLWRHPEPDGSFDPYKILVSEIMLQQTQVSRVTPKFKAFMSAFPDVQQLAHASLGDVLRHWQGLGYNRRAKFLWQAAGMVMENYGGRFPETQKELTKLPGVGINTAGALCVYAFNQPAVFIETNIRTVFLHHFFRGVEAVDDKQLIPLIEQTLDHEHPREWFWALMDYGSFLKAEHGNVSRASKHYTKQSAFAGSQRQIRGQVLKLLVTGQRSATDMIRSIEDPRLEVVLKVLCTEGLIVKQGQLYRLA